MIFHHLYMEAFFHSMNLALRKLRNQCPKEELRGTTRRELCTSMPGSEEATDNQIGISWLEEEIGSDKKDVQGVRDSKRWRPVICSPCCYVSNLSFIRQLIEKTSMKKLQFPKV